MIVFGLTGPSGAGTSSVLRVWAALGAFTIDADEVYHRLLREDAALLDLLKGRFPGAFGVSGLDRKALGRIVFADAGARRDLEALTHGAVVAAVEELLTGAAAAGFAVAAVDALYLLESPLRGLCRKVVGVVAPAGERVRRLCVRDGVSAAYATARIAAQEPEDYYRARCDVILENTADEAALVKQARTVYDTLTNEFNIQGGDTHV
ncbi:MAG: dephospho-CoA kinase [Oscillospiraceae bacterium]|jgi:dephospho-CoA kinase|nr:dephospho-CoA kinase [Oscillospiraceae bacterium]